MNAFYSKNKKYKSEELAKIEQKRYEELIQQERNHRKQIASASDSSKENKKETGLSRSIRAKRDSAGNGDAKMATPEAAQKSSTPLNVKPSDNHALDLTKSSSVSPIHCKASKN